MADMGSFRFCGGKALDKFWILGYLIDAEKITLEGY